jgi:hypothetical protein
MKKLSILLTILSLVFGMSITNLAQGGHDHGAHNHGKKKETTVTGFISDSHCGLKHMDGMGDEKACTLKCVEGGGHFVLADREGKVVYTLDKDSQNKAKDFAGQKVKVTGHVTGKSIHVTKIDAAS